MIFGFLARNRDSQEDELVRAARERRRKVREHLDDIRFFEGSREEYEREVGYGVRVIDSGSEDRRVSIPLPFSFSGDKSEKSDLERHEYLVSQGVEALVECTFLSYTHTGFPLCSFAQGVPVTKRQEDNAQRS